MTTTQTTIQDSNPTTWFAMALARNAQNALAISVDWATGDTDAANAFADWLDQYRVETEHLRGAFVAAGLAEMVGEDKYPNGVTKAADSEVDEPPYAIADYSNEEGRCYALPHAVALWETSLCAYLIPDSAQDQMPEVEEGEPVNEA